MTNNGDQRRTAIMTYITQHIESEGYPPTFSEIAVKVGYSPQSKYSVSIHLDKLEKQGLITRTPRVPRSIRLVQGATP